MVTMAEIFFVSTGLTVRWCIVHHVWAQMSMLDVKSIFLCGKSEWESVILYSILKIVSFTLLPLDSHYRSPTWSHLHRLWYEPPLHSFVSLRVCFLFVTFMSPLTLMVVLCCSINTMCVMMVFIIIDDRSLLPLLLLRLCNLTSLWQQVEAKVSKHISDWRCWRDN